MSCDPLQHMFLTDNREEVLRAIQNASRTNIGYDVA